MADHLYAALHDFPRSADVKTTYLLATLPRAGSTHFATELWRTGKLGAPLEYLNLPDMERVLMPRLLPSVGASTLMGYWTRVQQLRTSPNGVFGCKIFMQNLYVLIRRHFDVFQNLTPDFIVYLTRKDLVKQAISLSRAMRSAAWFADAPGAKANLEFDRADIDRCVELLKRQLDFWEDVFHKSNIHPIRVCYEDLVSAPDAAVSSVLTQMGLTRDTSLAIDIPGIKRQADESSSHWRIKYLSGEPEREPHSRAFTGASEPKFEASKRFMSLGPEAEASTTSAAFQLDDGSKANLRTSICASMISSLILEPA